jgi:hypothetical protein
MVKQVAIFNFVMLLGFSLLRHDRVRAGVRMVSGFLVFPLFFTLYFWSKGTLPDFMNAILFYGAKNISFDVIVILFRTAYIMLFENSVLWVLAAVAFFYIWLKERSFNLQLLTLWGLFSMIGVFVGGYALSHYFIQVMPALCLLSGVAIVRWREFGRLKNIMLMLLVILGSFIVIGQYEFYLIYTPEQISVAKYGSPINAIAQEIGEKIRERTTEDDYIFPRQLYQILFYAKRNSLSKYYLSHGGFYRLVDAKGKIIYSFDFRADRDPELAKKESEDFYQALHDRRTKYFIFMQDFVPQDIFQKLSEYRLDKELSQKEYGILVYKRIM